MRRLENFNNIQQGTVASAVSVKPLGIKGFVLNTNMEKLASTIISFSNRPNVCVLSKHYLTGTM